MAKSKKGSSKKEGAKPKAEKRARAEAVGKSAEKKEVPPVDLDTLRKPVEEAKASLDAAEAEAKQLTEKAHALVAGAGDGASSCDGTPTARRRRIALPVSGNG